MNKIVVGTTCPPFKNDDPRSILSWLTHAEKWLAGPDQVSFFAALEVDGRGIEPHTPLLTELEDVGGEHWVFSIDDHAEEITSHNRLKRICAGRNLIGDYAQDVQATHVLFLDTDVTPPVDALPKLLEVDWPIVGGHVPTYNLDGPKLTIGNSCGSAPVEGTSSSISASIDYWENRQPFPDSADVREHMTTAGFLLVRRDLFTQLRWRIDLDRGWTDDPCYHHDAIQLGYPTWVRHDVRGRHFPEQIGPLESRGHDLIIHRSEKVTV